MPETRDHVAVVMEMLDELRQSLAGCNAAIPEYNAGCPAQMRAIESRDKLQVKVDSLAALLAERELIRSTVIEECAKVGDRLYNARGDEVVDAIRALKR